MDKQEELVKQSYEKERAQSSRYLEFATREWKGEKFRVLFIDDEQRIIKFLAQRFSTQYEVFMAFNGEEGLEQVAIGNPDVIVLDIIMPKMDGYEMLKKLREFSAIPVIILSARGADSEKIKGLDLGADDYLPKPFNPDELEARIKAVLRRTVLVRPLYEQLSETQKDILRGKIRGT